MMQGLKRQKIPHKDLELPADFPRVVQGFKVLGDILHWFEKRNNWVGWSCFLLLYCVDVALFLPGLVLILAAGFVFG